MNTTYPIIIALSVLVLFILGIYIHKKNQPSASPHLTTSESPLPQRVSQSKIDNVWEEKKYLVFYGLDSEDEFCTNRTPTLVIPNFYNMNTDTIKKLFWADIILTVVKVSEITTIIDNKRDENISPELRKNLDNIEQWLQQHKKPWIAYQDEPASIAGNWDERSIRIKMDVLRNPEPSIKMYLQAQKSY